MQTDILIKQVCSTLSELKTAIEKFEKHPSPSTQYSESLYKSLTEATKLVSAYLVLKEQKDVAPDLDIHLKLMNVPTPNERKAILDAEPSVEPVEQQSIQIIQETSVDVIPTTNENEQNSEVELAIEKEPTMSESKKKYPTLVVNINDKFRMINDLFSGNSNEYNIAIEQINTVDNLDDAMIYIKGLKDIYQWSDEHEMVKKIISLIQKRFL